MNKKILLGSVGVVIVLVVASFSPIGSAELSKPNGSKITILQHIRDRIIDELWEYGDLMEFILMVLFLFLLLLSGTIGSF